MTRPVPLLPPPGDATEILRLRDGLYAVDLLGAAILYFDLFKVLHTAPSDLDGICRQCGIQRRPADVLMTLCTALGLVTNRQGLFHLTENGQTYLVPESPHYLGAYYAALQDRPVCQDYRRVLQTGRPANWGSFDKEKDWAKAMESDTFAKGFTAAMDCRGRILGPALANQVDLSNHQHLLDVAGGSGVYACACLTRHPHLRATILEKPPVDAIARDAVASLGLAGRTQVAVGDMFESAWPEGCDVHLLSNVLHDWDEPEVRRLLRRSHEKLPAGGLLLVHDAFLNRDKTGPLPVAMYSCLLMHSSEGKCYSQAEMEGFLAETGFAHFQLLPTAADRSVLCARKQALD